MQTDDGSRVNQDLRRLGHDAPYRSTLSPGEPDPSLRPLTDHLDAQDGSGGNGSTDIRRTGERGTA